MRLSRMLAPVSALAMCLSMASACKKQEANSNVAAIRQQLGDYMLLWYADAANVYVRLCSATESYGKAPDGSVVVATSVKSLEDFQSNTSLCKPHESFAKPIKIPKQEFTKIALENILRNLRFQEIVTASDDVKNLKEYIKMPTVYNDSVVAANAAVRLYDKMKVVAGKIGELRDQMAALEQIANNAAKQANAQSKKSAAVQQINDVYGKLSADLESYTAEFNRQDKTLDDLAAKLQTSHAQFMAAKEVLNAQLLELITSMMSSQIYESTRSQRGTFDYEILLAVAMTKGLVGSYEQPGKAQCWNGYLIAGKKYFYNRISREYCQEAAEASNHNLVCIPQSSFASDASELVDVRRGELFHSGVTYTTPTCLALTAIAVGEKACVAVGTGHVKDLNSRESRDEYLEFYVLDAENKVLMDKKYYTPTDCIKANYGDNVVAEYQRRLESSRAVLAGQTVESNGFNIEGFLAKHNVLTQKINPPADAAKPANLSK